MLNLTDMLQSIGVSLLVLLVITPTIYFSNNAESPFELFRAQILSLFSFFIFVQWLSKSIKEKSYKIRFSTAGLMIHGLTFAMFISQLLSINPYLSFWGTKPLPADSFRVTLYVSIIAFVVDQIEFKAKEIRLVCSSLNIVLFLQVFFGFLQIFGLDWMSWAHKGLIFGTSGNTIKYGTLIGILLINALYFFVTTQSKIYRYALAVLIFLAPYLQLHAGARTPIFVTYAAILSTLVYFLIKSDSEIRKKLLTFFLLFSGGALLFVADYQNTYLKEKMSGSVFSRALNVRKEASSYAFESWKKSPIFGNGPETYVVTQGVYQTSELNRTNWKFEWSKAHNAVLHYLTNTGIFGTFFLVSLFIYMMWTGIRLFFKGSRSENENLSFNLIVPYSYIFITNLTCFYCVFTQTISAVFPLFVIQLLNLRYFQIDFSNFKLLNKTFKVLATAGVTVLTFYSSAYWYSDLIYQEGRRLREFVKDSKASYEYYEKAISIFPYEAYHYCGAAHSLNDLLARNYLNLDTLEKVRTAGIIDQYVQECLDRAGNRQHTIFLAGKVYLVQVDSKFLSDPQKALNILYKALEITPRHPELHFRIGLMHFAKGDYAEFEKSLKKSIESKLDYIPAYTYLAEYYFRNNRSDEAKKIIMDALQVEFLDFDLHPTLKGLAKVAKLYNFNEGYEEAVKKFERDAKKIVKQQSFIPDGTH